MAIELLESAEVYIQLIRSHLVTTVYTTLVRCIAVLSIAEAI